jgi:nucleotide-binding universal stress UspA family protein
VRQGNPAEEILKVAVEEKVDLVIMGRNGKTRLRRLLAGCVTKEVERGATVPVIVAKTTGREKFLQYGWRKAYAAW